NLEAIRDGTVTVVRVESYFGRAGPGDGGKLLASGGPCQPSGPAPRRFKRVNEVAKRLEAVARCRQDHDRELRAVPMMGNGGVDGQDVNRCGAPSRIQRRGHGRAPPRTRASTLAGRGGRRGRGPPPAYRPRRAPRSSRCPSAPP